MGWKYIIFEIEYPNIAPGGDAVIQHVPILFPDTLVHSEVAKSLISNRSESNPLFRSKPIAAGFISFMSTGCVGKSETMGIGSRLKEDEDCINSFEYGVRGIKDQY